MTVGRKVLPVTPPPTTPLRVADHPNAWTEKHPYGCPSCQVCMRCFYPRRPDQMVGETCRKCFDIEAEPHVEDAARKANYRPSVQRIPWGTR